MRLSVLYECCTSDWAGDQGEVVLEALFELVLGRGCEGGVGEGALRTVRRNVADLGLACEFSCFSAESKDCATETKRTHGEHPRRGTVSAVR